MSIGKFSADLYHLFYGSDAVYLSLIHDLACLHKMKMRVVESGNQSLSFTVYDLSQFVGRSKYLFICAYFSDDSVFYQDGLFVTSFST